MLNQACQNTTMLRMDSIRARAEALSNQMIYAVQHRQKIMQTTSCSAVLLFTAQLGEIKNGDSMELSWFPRKQRRQ